MEWSNDVILEFLSLYENEPAIWNPKHPLHKNRNEVNDAWKRIEQSISIHCTVRDLKKKKDSLMATFRALCSKMESSKKSGSIDVPKPNWFAYETMEKFLKAVYQPKNVVSVEDVYDSTSDDFMVEDEGNAVTNAEDGPNDKDDTATESPGNPTANHTEKIYKHQKNNRNKRKGCNLSAEVEKRPKTVIEKPGRDYCSVYGELLAIKLRNLNDRTREIVMNDIDNLIFRAKMNHTYRPPPPNIPPFPPPYPIQPSVGYFFPAPNYNHPDMHPYTPEPPPRNSFQPSPDHSSYSLPSP